MTHVATDIRRQLQERLAKGEHFTLRRGQFNAVFAAEYMNRREAELFLDEIDTLIYTGKIIKDDRGSFISLVEWANQRLVIKRYNNQGILHNIRHSIKGSRAKRAWLFGHLLANIGVLTPQPVALIERCKGLLLDTSFIVTEHMPTANLHHFLRSSEVDIDAKKDIVTKIKVMLDTLWRNGICHGDMKHSNILVSDRGPVITDLDAMRLHSSSLLLRWFRRKDIRRFMRSTTDEGIAAELKDFCRQLFDCGFQHRYNDG